jgi:opacity protein-like surface antigen
MKSHTFLFPMALASLLGIATAAHPYDTTESRWYIRTDLGLSYVVETDVEEFLVPTPGLNIEFDPGIRFGVAGGYNALPWLAIEIESGVTANSVDNLGPDSIDAAISQVPFMANLVIHCNHFNRFLPFIGAGTGGVASVFAIDQPFLVGNDIIWLEGADTDVVFAWQAFAGLSYDLNENMGIGLTYRFLATEGPSWDVDDKFFSDRLSIRLDDVHTHSVSFAFNFRF